MDVKTYFDTKREMTNYCYKGECSNECPLSMMNNGMYVNCVILEQKYTHVAERIIQKYIDSKNTGYFCMKTGEPITDIRRCNKYESCTECQQANAELRMVVDLMDEAMTLKEMNERI